MNKNNLRQFIKRTVDKVLRKVLNEGIDFDPETKTVSFNPSHEENIDTSVENNPIGVTILMPSGSDLNRHIADVVMSKSKDAELIEGVICKMTTEEIDDIVLDFNSKFREAYKDDFNAKYYELGGYLDLMDKERNGYFSRHLIKNNQMRNILDTTLKLSEDRFAEFANKINGRDILIIDDTISRGQSIREICHILRESYAPKSITVLTLLSRLQ